MALKDLPIESMVSITGAWVDAKKDRAIVAKYPKLAPFLPDLDGLHDRLLSAGQREPSDVPAELERVREQLRELDRRHDAVVRGVDQVLAGLAQLAPKASTAATLEQLRETLLPEGRRLVKWSMPRQAGAAERALTRLTPAQKKALRDMSIPGGTILGFFNERVTLARKLVELDRQRVALLAALDDGGPVVANYDATLSFVRTVGLFVSIAEVSDMDEADRTRLLAGLEAAKDNAEARRAAQLDRTVDEAMQDLDASAEAQPADGEG